MLTNDELRQRVQRSLTSGALFPAPQTAWALLHDLASRIVGGIRP